MARTPTDNLIEEVKLIIAEVAECKPKEIGLDTNFYKDLGIDSIKAVEILVAIEKKFSVSIRDEQIGEITTVRQIANLATRLLAKTKRRKYGSSKK